MNTGKLIIIILASLGCLLLLICYVCYLLSFYTNRKRHYTPFHGLSEEECEANERKKVTRSLIEELIKIPCEFVSTESFDGLTLSARYYHVADGAPLEIQFHGFRSVCLHDFSGGSREALAAGHNLLLVDQRAHGNSEGDVISFGINERFDVLSWVNFARERFGRGVKILLVGISMGAATVLMSSSLNLTDSVVGNIADCPYSSPKEIIKKVIREDMHLPADLLWPFVWLGGVLFGRFNPSKTSATEAVKNTNIPILVIHGDGDKLVPIAMSEQIAACGDTVKFLPVKEAGHGLSYIYDRELYMTAVKEFHAEIFNEN